MAKKVINNDNKEEGVTHNASLASDKTDATFSPKAETEPRQKIPDQADRILKTLSNYPELYIDFQGGTYTLDTPPVFRSNATRYSNPYYTKP